MLNRCEFIGNLGKDPEVRTMQSGGKVASFSIAVSSRWTDKESGEKKERTTWVPIVIFNEVLISVAERFLRKGSKVYVAGEFSVRSYEKDGSTRYSTEVVLQRFRGELQLLDGKQDGGDSGGYGSGYGGGGQGDLDSEIPF